MFQSEPIFESQPTHPSCHAATVVELQDGGLLAAWFAGTHEGHPDVAIWLARYDGTRWDEPVRIADEAEVPLWNPVLYRGAPGPRNAPGVLWLFYKAGPSVPAWTGLYQQSDDEGRTWSAPTSLPAWLDRAGQKQADRPEQRRHLVRRFQRVLARLGVLGRGLV